jgi:hypothetical protein
MKNLNDLIPIQQLLRQIDDDMPPNPPTPPPIDLDEVKLIRFVARPESIDPFEASQITWEVEGPPTGWVLKLNGQTVDRSKTVQVEPKNTSEYILIAHSGNRTKNLGRVTVNVNLEQCQIEQVEYLEFRIRQLLYAWGREMTGLRFRGSLEDSVKVVATWQNISFTMKMEYVINNFSNPYINIKGDFNIGLTGDSLGFGDQSIIGYLKNLEIDADFTTWQWIEISFLTPIAAVIAAQHLDTARDMAREGTTALIDRIINTNIIQGTTPAGMDIHYTEVAAGNNGFGIFTKRYCPRKQRKTDIFSSTEGMPTSFQH